MSVFFLLCTNHRIQPNYSQGICVRAGIKNLMQISFIKAGIFFHWLCNFFICLAIAQAVRRRFLTAKAGVRVQVSLCGIGSTRSDKGQGHLRVMRFSLSSSLQSCFVSTEGSCGGWTKGPLAIAVPQRLNLTSLSIVFLPTLYRAIFLDFVPKVTPLFSLNFRALSYLRSMTE
jgi:hypothetical protein